MDDFAALQASIQGDLVHTTRSVSSLAAEDLAFHRSLDSSFGTQLDTQNERLLSLAQRLLGSATTTTEAVRPTLKDIDDVEGNWTKIVDVIDSLLERADTALDEFTGAVKRLTPRETTPNPRTAINAQKLAASFRNQDIEKPQLHFANATDNRPTGPFKPLLTTKPHASSPLAEEPSLLEESGVEGFDHPYRDEIEQYAYPSWIYDTVEPTMYDSFEDTAATFVDTEEAMEAMLEELKDAKEIAVDLEHHDQRSYIGIVCLMQISTRHHDWIVDTLKPWRRKLSKLNEVFANPAIVKVLHGAHMDIVWLQRDLGIYVVGLFDTYSAARALGYPAGSYAYLLKEFTGVDAQKQYQTADWRIRPLPNELVDYARSDTHYLLYIYDNMRNELIERSDLASGDQDKDKLSDVLGRTKETALQRYEHPFYDLETGQGSTGWYKLLSRTPAMFNKQQFAVMKAVHQWRDNIAREQDDNIQYIMPNHMIFTIAKVVPTTKADLLKSVQPLTQTIRLRADELVAVITKANEEGIDGPDMIETLQKLDPISARSIAMAARETSSNNIDGVSKYLSRAINAGKSTASSLMSSLPLRSVSSLFWGSSLNGRNKRSMSTISTTPAIQMTVPLPALTADVFATAQSSTASVQQEPSVIVPDQLQAAKSEEDQDVFVLKELNRKRKLAQLDSQDDGMAVQADEVALPDEERERLRLKAERKRAKKEAKRAAKLSSGELQDDDEAADEQPFDYASAPSVLTQPVQDKKARKNKKQFNPYGKTMDAPKGLPRVQKEGTGRSMTYAS